MHSVLNLKTNWADTQTDQSFKETLVQTCLGRFLAHNDWTQLAMIADKNYMFGTLEYGNQGLGLRGLCSFINKNLSKSEITNPAIKCCYTSRTNNICISQNFFLSLSLQVFELFFVFFIELSLVFFLNHKLLHSYKVAFLEVLDLFMQTKIIYIRADRLTRPGTESDYFETRSIDFVCKLVNSDI